MQNWNSPRVLDLNFAEAHFQKVRQDLDLDLLVLALIDDILQRLALKELAGNVDFLEAGVVGNQGSKAVHLRRVEDFKNLMRLSRENLDDRLDALSLADHGH